MNPATVRLGRPPQAAPVLLAFLLLVHGGTAAATEEPDRPNPPATKSAGRGGIGYFARDLGRNFRSIFDRQSLKPLLVGGALTVVMAPLDDDIRGAWSVRDGSSTVGKVGGQMGALHVVAPAVGGLFIAGRRSGDERFRSFTHALAQAVLIQGGMAQGLKLASRRERPDGSDRRSFPSGHAASAFAIAAVTENYYGRTAGILGYSAASFIASSRSRKDAHWASDVAAGAALGYIVGTSVARRTRFASRPGKTAFIPFVDPARRAIGFQVYFDSP